jgi:glycosyltransferase involved in cell wall biosynthesis
MPTISVITPVAPGLHVHLPEAYESLQAQGLPAGWSWEWLVQCDSMVPDDRAMIRAVLPNDEPRLSYGAVRTSGPATARTTTLGRATGELAKALDADDRLTPGALARDIHALSQPGVHWCASQAMAVSPTGEQRPSSNKIPPNGRIASGAAFEHFMPIEGSFIHPATLCARMKLLLALGGWPATPATEGNGLMMALDAVSDGWYNREVGLLYRRWAPQMTAQPGHVDPEEVSARLSFVRARVHALRQFRHLFTSASPTAPATDTSSDTDYGTPI